MINQSLKLGWTILHDYTTTTKEICQILTEATIDETSLNKLNSILSQRLDNIEKYTEELKLREEIKEFI